MDYTKGEWKSRHPINNDYTIYTGEYGEGIIQVAMLFESSPNAEANALLIAAAPDMYKALKRLYKIMAKDCGGCIRTELALGEAQEALAKAEGKWTLAIK